MADKDAVPTVIYDEIDSGVSGKAAGRIGEVLRQSAQGHQILCITHTAQIAALADCHLLIQKNVSNERTYTEIHPLDENGRVEALARLISGDHVTELPAPMHERCCRSASTADDAAECILQKGQLLTRRRSCDRVDNVNGDEGNKYPEVFCPEKSRLVQGITEQQGKYLPELQAECVRG